MFDYKRALSPGAFQYFFYGSLFEKIFKTIQFYFIYGLQHLPEFAFGKSLTRKPYQIRFRKIN